MSPELWTGIGELAVFVGVGGYTAWSARRADRQTRGTGNGFAAEVKDSLRRIERKVDDHIRAHADADVSARHR